MLSRRTQLSTRWASLLVLVSTVLSWSSGVAAEYQRSRGLYVCFSVSTIMLGVFIVTLRITTEDQAAPQSLRPNESLNNNRHPTSTPHRHRRGNREETSALLGGPTRSLHTAAYPAIGAHRPGRCHDAPASSRNTSSSNDACGPGHPATQAATRFRLAYKPRAPLSQDADHVTLVPTTR
ncbi:hypothetical protein HPB52_021564 [Rhipicephalus sanguineus]|uniref:Uncharacterized protein n=1 Tax=Rhipicephalus sanguineus TaxID=34632 RepID=A0A9D4PF86_RHISA|nr:hypothetical protein HPB52_021564 [Rhipicephalus sanguineus]